MNDNLITSFKKHRNTVLGLLLGSALVGIFLISNDAFIEKGIPSFVLRVLIYLVVCCILWPLLWNHLRLSFPRREKNKIGMIICINAEIKKQSERIKNDFVKNIRELLKQHGLSELFHVILINDLQSREVGDALDKYLEKREEFKKRGLLGKFEKSKEYRRFQRINRRIQGHFYIWGSIKERKDIENKYVIGLDCLVVHRPIKVNASEQFSQEIQSVFPKQISFYEKVELTGFSNASCYVLIVSRYIIGIAALLSRDVFFAYNLHKGLWDELRRMRDLPDPFKHMFRRIKEIMFIELVLKSRYAFYKEGDIEKSNKFMIEADGIEKNSVQALTFFSIYAFKVERNIVKAMKYLRASSKVAQGDYAWLYNKAFLNMYVEKFSLALEDYDRLQNISYEKEEQIIEECISFNKEILRSEPTKKQSKFIMGYLYYIKKGNLPEALTLIEEFLGDTINEDKYKELRIRANRYRDEIKKEMKISD